MPVQHLRVRGMGAEHRLLRVRAEQLGSRVIGSAFQSEPRFTDCAQKLVRRQWGEGFSQDRFRLLVDHGANLSMKTPLGR